LFGTGKLTLEDLDNLDIEEGQSNDDDDAYDGDATTTLSSSAENLMGNKRTKDYGATTTAASSSSETSATSTPKKTQRKHHWSVMTKTVKAASSKVPKITVDEVSGEPQRPSRSYCLEVFYFINICAIFTCLSVVASQMLPLFMIPLNQIEPVEAVLAVYISIIAVLFMVIEWGTSCVGGLLCMNVAHPANFR
jgi:hypothetical protein